MELKTWKRIAAAVGGFVSIVLGTAAVTGAVPKIIDANPLATKAFVESQLAGGFEPLQKLLIEQNATIQKGFADVQWTATVDRYNNLNALFRIDDAALQADLKRGPADESERVMLDRRKAEMEKRREDRFFAVFDSEKYG